MGETINILDMELLQCLADSDLAISVGCATESHVGKVTLAMISKWEATTKPLEPQGASYVVTKDEITRSDICSVTFNFKSSGASGYADIGFQQEGEAGYPKFGYDGSPNPLRVPLMAGENEITVYLMTPFPKKRW